MHCLLCFYAPLVSFSQPLSGFPFYIPDDDMTRVAGFVFTFSLHVCLLGKSVFIYIIGGMDGGSGKYILIALSIDWLGAWGYCLCYDCVAHRWRGFKME